MWSSTTARSVTRNPRARTNQGSAVGGSARGRPDANASNGTASTAIAAASTINRVVAPRFGVDLVDIRSLRPFPEESAHRATSCTAFVARR